MIIHIERHQHYFVQIDRRALEDPRLSWKATGLLAYLLTKPPDWKIRIEHLTSVKPGGRDLVLCGLQELRKYGYADVVNEHGDDGRFITRGYVVREEPEGGYVALPEGGKPALTLPQSDFPPEEKSSVGESESSKTEICSEKDPDAHAREDLPGSLAPAAALSQGAAQPEPPASHGEPPAPCEPDVSADAGVSARQPAANATPGPDVPASVTPASPPTGKGRVVDSGEVNSRNYSLATNHQSLTPPPQRPPGCEHLTSPPNDLAEHWARTCPDPEARAQWEACARGALARDKKPRELVTCKPFYQCRALGLYLEYRSQLELQGTHVNGVSLHPPPDTVHIPWEDTP